jgi:molecular chaperone GrpE
VSDARTDRLAGAGSPAGGEDAEREEADREVDESLTADSPLVGKGGEVDPALGEPGPEEGAAEPEAGEAVEPGLEAQRDEYLDALRRLQADFENYKKRVARQQAELFERANEGLVVKLLPVLDTADLAEAHSAGEEVGKLRSALLDVLGREGLERIAPDGGAFDPNLHDAVAHEPGEGGPQEVAALLRAGYLWHGRVLRPAMVKVRG